MKTVGVKNMCLTITRVFGYANNAQALSVGYSVDVLAVKNVLRAPIFF